MAASGLSQKQPVGLCGNADPRRPHKPQRRAVWQPYEAGANYAALAANIGQWPCLVSRPRCDTSSPKIQEERRWSTFKIAAQWS
jgi:hypothetical protein